MHTNVKIKGNGIVLRPVKIEDAELLFNWRNDETTRLASHSNQPLKFSEHLKWLQSSLRSKTRSLYIAEHQNQSVGTIRTDYLNGSYLLSWTIAPDARGRGVGKHMVGLLTSSIQDPVKAEIKKDNLASIRIAVSAGLELQSEDEDGVLHFSRNRIS